MGNNYILVGMPGAGKSTVGKFLANKLDYDFIDLDCLIEELEGVSITDIFKSCGEEYFRLLETRVIKSLASMENKVIATGGGSFEKEENRSLLKELGHVIYLYAAPELLHERIKDTTGRPLLNVDEPQKEIKLLFDKRHGNYGLADCVIDTTCLSVYNIAEEIIKVVNGKNTGN